MSGDHVPQAPPALGLRTTPVTAPAPVPQSSSMAIPTRPAPRRGSFSMSFGTSPSPKRAPMSLGAGLSASPSEHTNVLRRLSAMFQPSDGDPSSPRSTFLLESPRQDMSALGASEAAPFKDRNAIKVKVVTWNMADALPKGDLSVLLGEVPPYEAPAPSDDIPELPMDDAHPYHIVVFAAQECPAPSGMPRGLGGSLMKGVGLQKSEAHRREKDEKKEEERDARKTLKEIRREYKEKEGPIVTLKDLKAKDKGAGLGLITDDVLEKPTKPNSIAADSSTDSDSSAPTRARVASVRRHAMTEAAPNGTTRETSVSRTDTENDCPPEVPIVGPSETPNAIASCDSAPGALDPTHASHIVKQPNGVHEPSPLSLPASPQIMDKPSREQLRIDPLFKRKAELAKESSTPASARGHTPFDIGLGSPMTDTAGSIARGGGPRGWSAMLEEWLCAGPPVCREVASPLVSPGDLADGPQLGHSSHLTPSSFQHTASFPTHHRALSSSHHRSVSSSHKRSPSSSSAVKPISIPSNSLPIPARSTVEGSYGVPSSIPHGRSTLGQSVDTSGSSMLAPPEGRPPMARSHSGRELGRSPGVFDSPISMDEPLVKRWYRQPGAGPYVNVAKERLLGLYISVFVYKGCEHLVEGVDKDFVTTGLAGGRFGNKGGIGVSLKLKGHRLLFVNAHLAAHAERNDARLANISKIKSELNLDCFLPPDDPRAALEDITDRFDTTFWCGDLNFRVDISLLHAKWLLEKKQYPEALMFDQLRKVMADPKCNPLPGFEEADITFMPTFKYDVWKSVRATNKDKRKSVRRSRRASDKSERPSMERPSSPSGRLDFVPEIEGMEESSDGPDSPEVTHGVLHCSEPPVMSPVAETPPRGFDLPLPDTMSLASLDREDGVARERERDWDRERSREATPHSSSRKSTTTLRSERSELDPDGANGHGNPAVPGMSPLTQASHDVPRRASGAWSRESRDWSRTSRDTASRSTTQELVGATKRGGSNLKAKTQKLMGILRLGRKPAARPLPPAMPADAASARRHSQTSFRSNLMSEDGRLSVLSENGEAPYPAGGALSPNLVNGDFDLNTTPQGGGFLLPDGAPVHRTTSTASIVSASGRKVASPPRRPNSLIRSFSGRSLNEDAEDEEDCTIDTRTGVYDTSKKQRVPSWCDRVLWKTHVIPDPVDDAAEMDDNVSIASSRDGPLLRLSHAFSNLSGRMRRRSSFMEPGPEARPSPPLFPSMSTSISAPNGLAPAVAPDELAPVFESDPPTPADGTPTTESSRQLGDSTILNPLASTLPAHIRSLSSPARRRGRSVTFEAPAPLALSLRRELSPTAEDQPSTPTPPLNGLGNGAPPSSPLVPRRASSSTESTPSRGPSFGLGRRMSMSSIGSIGSSGSRTSRRRSEDPTLTRTSPTLHPLKAVRSTGQYNELGRPRAHRGSDGAISMTGQPNQTGLSALTRFFRDLPGRFHSRVSLFHGSEPEVEEEPVVEGPKRHLVGEVQVLHYGTIDDAGMRQLEGRSDHRPAIFSAAVYV